MKHGKILIAILVIITILISIATLTSYASDDDVVIFLRPNSNWKTDNARFAVYVWNSSGDYKWFDMTDSEGDGIYTAAIPVGYTNIIFCRMNPSSTKNGWSEMWNQTEDLKLPNNGDNHYKVASGTWDKGGGTWSYFDSTACVHTSAGEGTILNPASCKKEGKISYNCSKCNELFTETISAKGHSYNEQCICVDCGAEIFYIIAGNVMKISGTESYAKGDNSTLFGSKWDVADENNRMFYSLEDEYFVKIYTGVAAGEYHFKVAEGKSWDVSYGHDGGNCYLKVDEDGSTVVITFKNGTITTDSKYIPESNNPETPDKPNAPEEPENPEQPDDSHHKEPNVKLNFFQKIWRAIVNFFRRLFGVN